METISIIIPAYNEELTIGKVIKDFKKQLPDANIYVYDNNSTDNTAKIAEEAGAIVRKEYKQGKGNVIRSSFKEIDSDIYVMVDADDTYPAEVINELIEPVKNGQADMVTGDRLSNGTYKKQMKKISHKFGNNLVKNCINLLFDIRLNDIMTGYRVFNKKIVKNMPIMSQEFELETEMTLFAVDKKYIIKEIPIEYRERPNGSKSKIKTLKDGRKVIKTLIKMFRNHKPLKFFTILFTILFIIGLLVGIPVIVEFYKTGYITKIPSAILATGLITLAVICEQSGLILQTIVEQHKEEYELNLLRYEQIEKLKNK